MRHDPETLEALEPAQLSVAAERPLPRRHLGRGMRVMLVAVRVYVLIAVPVVVYAFIHALVTAHPSH